MIAYHLDIYEVVDGQPDLVLTHTTYGADEQEARELMATHAEYDAFLRAALTTKRFEGIVLDTEEETELLEDESEDEPEESSM